MKEPITIKSDEERRNLVEILKQELVPLRAKADISQDDLAAQIGVSRQTYGAIERGDREMTWNTYLSLIFFYDYNRRTHQMLRETGAFPGFIFAQYNGKDAPAILGLEDGDGIDLNEIISSLDEQALRAIRTVIMLEYARCSGTSGDAVVRAFDGINFTVKAEKNEAAEKALREVRRKTRREKNKKA